MCARVLTHLHIVDTQLDVKLMPQQLHQTNKASAVSNLQCTAPSEAGEEQRGLLVINDVVRIIQHLLSTITDACNDLSSVSMPACWPGNLSQSHLGVLVRAIFCGHHMT